MSLLHQGVISNPSTLISSDGAIVHSQLLTFSYLFKKSVEINELGSQVEDKTEAI